ncbi:MAG TPA: hypothetical protein VKE22_29475 [Haliangiales bacterium]|nr:hypothetical protein [Haliangiales bacterium]
MPYREPDEQALAPILAAEETWKMLETAAAGGRRRRDQAIELHPDDAPHFDPTSPEALAVPLPVGLVSASLRVRCLAALIGAAVGVVWGAAETTQYFSIWLLGIATVGSCAGFAAWPLLAMVDEVRARRWMRTLPFPVSGYFDVASSPGLPPSIWVAAHIDRADPDLARLAHDLVWRVDDRTLARLEGNSIVFQRALGGRRRRFLPAWIRDVVDHAIVPLHGLAVVRRVEVGTGVLALGREAR